MFPGQRRRGRLLVGDRLRAIVSASLVVGLLHTARRQWLARRAALIGEPAKTCGNQGMPAGGGWVHLP